MNKFPDHIDKGPVGPCDQILDAALKFAKKQFEDDGELRPYFIMVDKDSQCIPVLAEYANDQQKHAMLWAMRKLLAENHSTRYLVVNEAWARHLSLDQVDMDNDGMAKDGIRPKDAPDRVEIVVVTDVAMNPATGRAKARQISMPIIRPEGRAPYLGEAVEFKTDKEGHSLSGLFTELLDPPVANIPGIH
jgi:hypothetical protein